MRGLLLSVVLMALLALAAARPFVGVLVWSWISFMNPHREAWGFVQSMPWAMIAFIITVFGCFVAREPKKLTTNALTTLIIVFGVGITLTSLTALAPPSLVWAKWDRTIKMLMGLLLTAALLTSRDRIHALTWLIVISLGFYGVKGGIFTLMTGGGFQVVGPPDTMIADRNHAAVAMLFSIPLMNYLRLQSRHRLIQWGLAAAMMLTLVATIGSQSRGALVGTLATGFVFWMRSRGKLLSGISIVLALALLVAFMPESWVERMNTIGEYREDESAMGRVTIWRIALLLALRRPLVGGGFRAVYVQDVVDFIDPTITARATHSIWFEVLGEHGFVVFFVWLAMFAAGIVYSMQLVRMARGRSDLDWARDLGRMAQVSMVAYAVGGTFLSLAYWDGFWTLMVVLGAACAVARQGAPERARTNLVRMSRQTEAARQVAGSLGAAHGVAGR